ncbi:MAG: DUF2878 domain-containing protein [Aeromonas sp.]
MWQWAHLLGFNLYWLVAVKWQLIWPLLAMLLLHLIFSLRRRQDLRLLPIAMAGCALDGLLWQLGFFEFAAGFPLWLVLLWVGFALSLSHSMRWLLRAPLWGQGVFGVCGGAGSYLAAAGMGAVQLPWGIWPSAAVLGVIWGAWLPLLLWAMVKLDGKR